MNSKTVRRGLCVALAAAIIPAALLVACDREDGDGTATPAPTASPTPTPSSTPTPGALAQMEVTKARLAAMSLRPDDVPASFGQATEQFLTAAEFARGDDALTKRVEAAGFQLARRVVFQDMTRVGQASSYEITVMVQLFADERGASTAFENSSGQPPADVMPEGLVEVLTTGLPLEGVGEAVRGWQVSGRVSEAPADPEMPNPSYIVNRFVTVRRGRALALLATACGGAPPPAEEMETLARSLDLRMQEGLALTDSELAGLGEATPTPASGRAAQGTFARVAEDDFMRKVNDVQWRMNDAAVAFVQAYLDLYSSCEEATADCLQATDALGTAADGFLPVVSAAAAEVDSLVPPTEFASTLKGHFLSFLRSREEGLRMIAEGLDEGDLQVAIEGEALMDDAQRAWLDFVASELGPLAEEP